MSTHDEPIELLSRTAIKARRLKLAPGQQPAKRVYSHKRRDHIELFDPRECHPMREKREPTEAQRAALAAGRHKLTHTDCCRCGEKFHRDVISRAGLCPTCSESERYAERMGELAQLVAAAPAGSTIYLDVETTGLFASVDELLEVAIVDDAGAILVNTLVRPVSRTEWPDAQLIHGITPEDVAGAPLLDDLVEKLAAVIESAEALVIYNAPFDLSFLPALLQEKARKKARCAMQAFSLWAGEWSDRHGEYRRHKLADAAYAAGHTWDGAAHRAHADTLAVRSVWQWLRDRAASVSRTISDFDGEPHA